MRPCCNPGNQHPFYHAVRIAFHHAAVHKCARITLITIADHIFNFFILRQHLRPFPSGGKSAAAAPAQRRLRHFVHNLLRRHIEQSLCHRSVSAHRYVLLNGFGVNPSTVL